jgi:hypothetical protein
MELCIRLHVTAVKNFLRFVQMTPAAAKLLMCVCAGSTGALVVPAAHKARAAMSRPSVHRAAVRSAAAPAAIAAAPCLQITSAPPALTPVTEMPAESGSGDLAQLTGVGANAFAGSGSGLAYGGINDDGVGGGALVGGVGIGGSGGAGGVIAPAPIITPVSGAVPEAASWAMMIGGFGTLGTAMRWQRRATA